MTEKIFLGQHNETHMFVTSTNEGVERELASHFTFTVPGFQFMPTFKTGRWDGKIRLYNRGTKLLYKGLVTHVQEWGKKFGYLVEIDRDLRMTGIDGQVPVPLEHEAAWNYIKSLNIPDEYEIRGYQLDAFVDAIKTKRLTVLSPTGSGKSLIIYMIAKYHQKKVLIIVPTLTLLHQIEGDFRDYGCTDDMHLIFSGKDKNSNTLINITTWQSIFRLKSDFFNQFHTIIVDETHHAKSTSLRNVLEKSTQVKHRYGFTGTLDGKIHNKWVIEGLIGPVYRAETTSNLIEKEVLARFNIHAMVIKYSVELCDMMKGQPYQKEIEFLIGNERRNKMIVKLATTIPGNNLIIINRIAKHGDILMEMLRETTDRPLYYIHGGVDAKERDGYRALIEKEKDAIIVAGVKAFATGTNIVKLNNIIFAHPSKARIGVLQAIGRVLRMSKSKRHATLYDIADDLSTLTRTGKSRMNHTLKHFKERIKIYQSESFPFKVFNIKADQ